MAKDKDEVTQEVTTRPGFSTHVSDAPDHDPNATTPSQRVQEEQAAGRAAVRDAGRTPAATGGTLAANPADRDPAHAAEVAIQMNAEHEEEDRRDADRRLLPEGELDPGEVPSRGYPYQPIAGEENTQGTAAYKTADPRLQDPDTELGQRAEGLKMAREAEEARVKEQSDRDQKDKQSQQDRSKSKK